VRTNFLLAELTAPSPDPLLAAALTTLERTLVVRADAAAIIEYFRAAYRRSLVPVPVHGDDRTDRGEILENGGAEWLRFNGHPVAVEGERPLTNFRLAFYGASKLVRLSFRRNPAWYSLYAAALRVRGRAVLISAQSGIGKTTLALELISCGARLYSDEFAFVRKADRMVSGLPRALMIRERTLALFPDPRLRRVCDASEPRSGHGDRIWDNIDAGEVFGESVFAEPAPLAAAFMLERAEGRGKVESVSPALAAVDFTKRMNADAEGFARLVEAAGMLEGVACYRITAAKPKEAAACIQRLLA
jgi:hypothetical protein